MSKFRAKYFFNYESSRLISLHCQGVKFFDEIPSVLDMLSRLSRPSEVRHRGPAKQPSPSVYSPVLIAGCLLQRVKKTITVAPMTLRSGRTARSRQSLVAGRFAIRKPPLLMKTSSVSYGPKAAMAIDRKPTVSDPDSSGQVDHPPHQKAESANS